MRSILVFSAVCFLAPALAPAAAQEPAPAQQKEEPPPPVPLHEVVVATRTVWLEARFSF